MVALALVLPLGSMLSWKRASLGKVWAQVWPFAIFALALGCLAYAMQTGRSALGPIGTALGAWTVMGALVDIAQRTGRGSLGSRIARLTRLPGADWGKAAAHIGLGVMVFGVAGITAWQQEDIRVTQIGERFEVGSYSFELRDVTEFEGPNYRTTMGEIAVFKGASDVTVLYPEKRYYPVADMPTTEAAIRNGILRDIYVVIGDPQDDGGYTVRVYIKPFANWIWGGAMLMALGGLFSLMDRRLRMAAGAAKPAASAVKA